MDQGKITRWGSGNSSCSYASTYDTLTPISPRPSSSSSPSPLFALLFKKNLKLIHTEAKITNNLCYPSKEYLHFILAVLKIQKDFSPLFRHLCTRIHDTTLSARLGQKEVTFVSIWVSFYRLLDCVKGAKNRGSDHAKEEGWAIRTFTLHNPRVDCILSERHPPHPERDWYSLELCNTETLPSPRVDLEKKKPKDKRVTLKGWVSWHSLQSHWTEEPRRATVAKNKG